MNGTQYDEDELSDITVTQSIDNKALFGVATGCLSFRVYDPYGAVYTEGAELIFSDGTFGTMHPKYYATSVSRDGNVVSITGYDTCKNLDVSFDYSGYEQFDGHGTSSANVRWYNTSSVLGDLANQCGFAPSQPSVSRVTQMCYNDFAGKTCRQILEELSKAECGFWKCANDNTLTFVSYSKVPDAQTIDPTRRTVINVGQSKSINGVHMEDTVHNEVTVESSVSWRQTETISGRFLDESRAAGAAGQIIPSTYAGFSVRASVNGMFSLGNAAVAGGGRITEAVYHFGEELIADLSAPAPDTSFSPYQTIYQRMIEDRVTQGKTMGTVFIGETGSGYRLKL